jgi:hypothetical protein
VGCQGVALLSLHPQTLARQHPLLPPPPFPLAADTSSPGATAEGVAQLVAEAALFTLASHLMWALWSFPMACAMKPAQFGYVEYGHQRLSEYFRLKEAYLKEHGAVDPGKE